MPPLSIVAVVVAGHDKVRAADVAAVVVGERADEGHLVGHRGDLGERAAEGHAGQARGDLAGGAADIRPGPHAAGRTFRRASGRRASQTQTTEVFLTGLPAAAGLRAGRQQLRQCQRAGTQRADLQKIAAVDPFAVAGVAIGQKVQHGLIPPSINPGE